MNAAPHSDRTSHPRPAERHPPAQANVLLPVKVADDVCALLGPLGQRDVANAGDIATFGAIVTPDGVILIDSDTTKAGAELIETTLETITPTRAPGDQHRQPGPPLAGNATFAAQGTEIMVRGHGKPCSLTQAQTQTGDYLDWLVREVRPAVEDMGDMDKTRAQRLHAAAPGAFRKLDRFEGMDRKNITRAYLEFQ